MIFYELHFLSKYLKDLEAAASLMVVCPIALEKRLERENQLKKNLRSKYSYGINDKSRDEETNILVGLQFPSINRGVARTAWPRPTSVPAAKTAYAFFEQTYLINCMVLSCHVRALE